MSRMTDDKTISVEEWDYFLVAARRHFGRDPQDGAAVIVEQDEEHGGRRAHVIFQKRNDGYRGLFYRRLDLNGVS